MVYIQRQKIMNVSGATNNNFGSSVDIDGVYAIIGEEGNDISYLYKRNINKDWNLVRAMNPSLGSGSMIGGSVAVRPGYVVLGAYGASSEQGSAVVYYDDGNDGWDDGDMATLNATDAAAGDRFGRSVAIDEDFVVVGAPNKSSNTGAAYVFHRTNSTNSWSQIAQLVPSVRTINDYFGISVAISGDYILVGAQGDNNSKGAVYIFKLNSGVWTQVRKIFASDGLSGDLFGCSVSIHSDYFIVGAKSKISSSGDIGAGAAYIYNLSGTWYEVDKLEGTGETSYGGNNFGHSVYIKEDHIVIGSPEARNGKGVADIYHKKRGWNHLTKIVPLDSTDSDKFGTSVAISSSSSVVGSPYEDEKAIDAGASYIFEDLKPTLRLAQEFYVGGEFIPSKASVYLKRMGSNDRDYFLIDNIEKNVFDATNFLNITRGDNRIYLNDSIDNFTGNGYMFMDSDEGSTFDTLNYPIKAVEDDTFNLWVRCISLQSNTFKADILIDGNESKTIDFQINDPSLLKWVWVSTTIVIPDTSDHILGIKIKESQAGIDKIYIDADDVNPFDFGPDYNLNPYVTVHSKLYSSNSAGSPDNHLFTYDYKNTVEQVVIDDWYNFNISIMDGNHGYTQSSDFVGSYAVVLSSTGGDYKNFVIWEMVNNDEYCSSPSSIKL